MSSSNSDHLPADVFDTRRLRLLVAVDESGTLTAAARRLCLTQSAVSHSLRKLEEEAGVQLVERNERGAALTSAGECLARHAAVILSRMTAAREDLHRLKNWGADRLRVGAGSTVCQYLLPGAISGFRRVRPRCRVEISDGDEWQRLEDLRGGRIDLALVTRSELSDPDLTVLPLFEEKLCLALPARPSDPEAELTVIGSGGNSSFAREAHLLMQLLRPGFARPLMELGSLESIRALVALGAGMAVLPAWLVRRDVQEGRIVTEPAPDDTAPRQCGLVHRRGHQLSISENEWVTQCRIAGRKLAEGA